MWTIGPSLPIGSPLARMSVVPSTFAQCEEGGVSVLNSGWGAAECQGHLGEQRVRPEDLRHVAAVEKRLAGVM